MISLYLASHLARPLSNTDIERAVLSNTANSIYRLRSRTVDLL